MYLSDAVQVEVEGLTEGLTAVGGEGARGIQEESRTTLLLGPLVHRHLFTH